MAILLPAAPACNAAQPSVRPDLDPVPVIVQAREPADEFITGVFTEEKFQQWLDSHPRRRWGFERRNDVDQADERKRVARLFALRTSPMAAELLAASRLAGDLQEAVEGVVKNFAPMEARRVLVAFGLAIPTEEDICQGWGGDTFAEARRHCRRLARQLEEFRDVVWTTIQFLIPPSERTERDTPAVAKGGAE